MSFPTPFYLLDLDRAAEKFRELKEQAGPGRGLCFAMKCNPGLIRTALPHVDRLEVCSFGEYRICRDQGIPADKLLISGVVKKEQELLQILDECGGRCLYTVESEQQYRILRDWAARRQTKVQLFLRLSSGNQFGMDAEQVDTLLQDAGQYPFLSVGGIHYYSGTQKRDPQKIIEELTMLDSYLRHVEEDLGVCLRELEYGPGIPAPCFLNQKQPPQAEYMQAVRSALDHFIWPGHVTLEIGRLAASSAGFYVTEVQDVKMSGETIWCLVDGGIHQLHYDGQIRTMYQPRVQLLHRDGRLTELTAVQKDNSEAGRQESAQPQEQHLRDMLGQLLHRQIRSEQGHGRPQEHEEAQARPARQLNVCGSLCTVNDLLLGCRTREEIRPGDILIFDDTGAYSMMEGMALFLSHEIPAAAGYSKAEGVRILRRRRETYAFWEKSSDKYEEHSKNRR